jgi:putative two-component system response regulator
MASDQKKIIAVDDIPDNLTAIRNTLKDMYEVYPCPSAMKMFELLEHVKPDLIMLDVGMPDMDGYEAIKKLKADARFKDVPVIFLSAMSDEKSEMEGLKLGAVDYIHKPFVTPLLLQRIKIHLSMSEQQKTILDRNREIEDFLKKISNSPT